MSAYLLLNDQSANVDGTPKTLGASGDRVVFISGVFDGATVTLQVESPNKVGTWIPLSEGVFTEVQAWILIGVRDELNIRAVLSAAGGSTDVTVEISK